MTRLTDAMTQAAIRFVWLTGRVLDQRRLAYFTGDGDRDGVLGALAAYGTTDGAYAFGLEPDIKGPEAQPLTAMTAMRIRTKWRVRSRSSTTRRTALGRPP